MKLLSVIQRAFLVVVCLIGVSTIASAQSDSLRAVKEVTIRGGLPSFFNSISKGKAVKVAFLGGSITRAGNGYRDQLLTWMRAKYPTVRFQEIMAAVSGTASDFGACRVKQHVIDHRPDLVFVEFAVNDNRRRMQQVRENIEGIVRQLWKANKKTDICFIYTLASENLALLQQGLFPTSVTAMEAVADHYDIPSIHMGLAIIRELESGQLRMMEKKEESSTVPLFSKDGVHPLPETGHKIYTQVLAANIPRLQTTFTSVKHRLPDPLEPGNWSNAGMARLRLKKNFSGNWNITDSVTKGKEYNQLLPSVFSTNSVDATLTVKFKGIRFGLADIMGPTTAAIAISIDNQPPRTINRFDAFSTYYRLNYFIISGLSPGRHTATIRLSEVPINKAAILSTRNVVVKDWEPYQQRNLYIGAVLF